MADHEGFLGRWSRLKREETAQAKPPAEPPPAEPLPTEPLPGPEPEECAGGDREGTEPPPLPPLPPIESLGADSDYTRFLAPDVPEELRRLAMRRAWTTDPKIAGFRGFGEYDWDFNAPGYGRLLAGDDIGRLLDAIGHEPVEKPSADEGADAERAQVAQGPEDPGEAPEAQETQDPDEETSGLRKC